MKKILLLMMGLVMTFGVALAETATATFKSKEGQKLQIIINKKVINAEPKSVVKIKGSGGMHQVKIKVYNGQELYVTKEQLRITPGYRNDYVIFVNKESRVEVKKTGRSMMYNSRHRRPDRFYNKRFYSFQKTPSRHHDLFFDDKMLRIIKGFSPRSQSLKTHHHGRNV